MKKTFLLLLAVWMTPLLSAEESPRIDQRIDDGWKFSLADNATNASPSIDDSKWQVVTLPHDWSIAGPNEATNAMGGQGGFFPSGTGWYRYPLDVPTDWKGKKVMLEFEGVYQHAEVFLNGTSITNHPYGYTSFFADLTSVIKPGEINTLAVRVDNSLQKNSRWYSGSGIYRHVRLIVSDPVHVAPWGVFVTVPKAETNEATVSIQSEVVNDGQKAASITVKNTLFGPDGGMVASFPSALSNIEPGQGKKITQEIPLKNPALWSLENPQLSKVVTTIQQGEKVVDKVTTVFGIRHLAWSPEKGMTINGKTVKLNGGCIHHDNGPLGACAFDRAEERKIEILKKAGFNAIRTAHNPPSPELLDACDRVGMLVMDEAFDCWANGKNHQDYSTVFKDWWERDIDAMVRRDRNHPSVVLWSIGNEIPGLGDAMGGEYGPKLANRVRSNDPTRPVTDGILGWPVNTKKPVAGTPQPPPDPKEADKLKNYELNWDSLDIVGSNYALGTHIKEHDQHPKRILVSTESSPPVGKAYEVLDNPFVVGDFVWSAQDYLGEVGVGRSFYEGDPTEPLGPPKKEHPDQPGGPVMHGNDKLFPWRGANPGDVDLIGNIKAACHHRNVIWGTEKLSLAVRQPIEEGKKPVTVGWGWWPTFESWTWPGQEGKKLTADIHSRYEKVRLYLNDQLIDEKSTGRSQYNEARIEVPYAPGVLKVVGVQDGKEVESKTLETVGDAVALKLSPDRSQIHADGQDLSFVMVEAVDAKGRMNPNADQEVTFKLEGPASIAGLGNALLKSTEPYLGTSCHLYHGRALIVIRSNHTAGDLTLKATAAGLNPAEAKITTE
ncbi:MAG: glycoside hydrolase family 2 TIM barrel-domain containing protein [bacterium]